MKISRKREASLGGSGVSLCGVLGIVFLVLKLTNLIDWPWIWVLSPFWLPIAIVFGIILIVLLIAFILALFGGGFSE